jgi:hypothetical protein
MDGCFRLRCLAPPGVEMVATIATRRKPSIS